MNKNRVKDSKRIIIRNCIIIALPCICVFSLIYIMYRPIVLNFVPVERTWFLSWKSFENAMNDNHCIELFVEEVPDSAKDMRYYWQRVIANRLAAYSMFLEKSDYENLQEEQVIKYMNFFGDPEKEIVYVHEEGEHYYIEDSEFYREELAYIDEVLHEPENKSQYYFFIISKFGTSSGSCYDGIILNDATMEVIEFSCERMESEKMR